MASDSGAPPRAASGRGDNEDGPGKLAAAFDRQLSISSLAVHADDYINTHQAVAPPLHVSTTFRYASNPDELSRFYNHSAAAPYDSHIYSRYTAPNTSRLEAILTSILGAPSLTYASGLAAFHAMLVFLNPKRIAISDGYHGCHGVIRVLHKLTGLEQLTLADEDLAKLQPGDIIHVETPVNPTGEARDLAYFRKRADEAGAYLTVDATFGPPPLQDPFQYGVDVVMHSGTKYFGGHSDMLCGVLAVRPDCAGPLLDSDEDAAKPGWILALKMERQVLGGVMGSLEGWLGVRSMRTLELRVRRESESAGQLVQWLLGEIQAGTSVVGEMVGEIRHASVQPGADDKGSWLRKQMPNGFGPVFAMLLHDVEDAKRLPSKLHLFQHATSLGGVESLIEWRAMTDKTVDRRLLRVSVGVEGWEDLRDDLIQGFNVLQAEKAVRK